MRLSYSEIEKQIEIVENKTNLLVIESPSLLRRFVSNFRDQVSSGVQFFFLYDGAISKCVSEKVEMIIDFSVLELESKKIQNAINSQLLKVLNSEDFFERTQQMKTQVLTLFSDALFNVDLPLVIEDDLEEGSLLKLLNPSIDITSESFLEKLITYFRSKRDILGISIFILVNSSCFLSSEEIEILVRECFRTKIDLVFVEGKQNTITGSEVVKTVIDADLCEIY